MLRIPYNELLQDDENVFAEDYLHCPSCHFRYGDGEVEEIFDYYQMYSGTVKAACPVCNKEITIEKTITYNTS